MEHWGSDFWSGIAQNYLIELLYIKILKRSKVNILSHLMARHLFQEKLEIVYHERWAQWLLAFASRSNYVNFCSVYKTDR